MATIVIFRTSSGVLIEIDPSKRRIRQVTNFVGGLAGDKKRWMDGSWVRYESTAQPIRPGYTVQFKGCSVETDPYEAWDATFWDIEDFVGIRTEPDSPFLTWDVHFGSELEPEPELEDLVGPMRSDVIIRGAAELAASIFVQQGWADVWDPEEIEAELIATVGRARRLGRGQLSHEPFRRLHVTKGTSGKTYLSIDLDAISPEDFETEA